MKGSVRVYSAAFPKAVNNRDAVSKAADRRNYSIMQGQKSTSRNANSCWKTLGIFERK